MSETRLAALLCSRLCHDIVSPLGAISNGVELLRDDDDPGIRAQALDLLEDSAGEALRRLTFFRIAFGMAGGMADELPTTEVRRAAEGLFHQGRVKLDWPDAALPPLISKEKARILLNLLLTAVTCLPRGGLLTVGAAAGAWQIAAAGQGARLEDRAAAALAGKIATDDLDPILAVPYLVTNLVKNLGARIETGTGPSGIELTIVWR